MQQKNNMQYIAALNVLNTKRNNEERTVKFSDHGLDDRIEFFDKLDQLFPESRSGRTIDFYKKGYIFIDI